MAHKSLIVCITCVNVCTTGLLWLSAYVSELTATFWLCREWWEEWDWLHGNAQGYNICVVLNALPTQGDKKDFWSGPAVLGAHETHTQWILLNHLKSGTSKLDQPDRLLGLCYIACLWEGLQDLPQPLNNFRGLRVTTSDGPTLNEAEFNCWLSTQDHLHLMRRKELQLVMGDKQTEAPLQAIQLLLDTACHSGERREQVTVYCYTSISGSSTSCSTTWRPTKLNLLLHTSTIRRGS